ncbi:MAG TPA: AIPR family protein [Kofleriaceae bacterium]|nr:AIPR family protein [Kofleriaceae bacterium]
MSVVHVRQIANHLETRFSTLIDMSDVQSSAKPEARTAILRTRAVAAYSVALLGAATDEAAAKSVTDQYADDGIDAIYYEPAEQHLYLVQSKFVQNGTSGIESGEILKFVQGVRHLIIDMDFSQLGAKIKSRQNEIRSALLSASTKIILVVAHTSTTKLLGPSKRPIDDLLSDLNDASDMARFHELGQPDIHAALAGTAEGAPINLDVILTDWGQVKEPYKAYYGQVSLNEISAWYNTHGDRLFAKNLRKMITDSEVNKVIAETAQNRPSEFWYFNNGITVLCSTVAKKAMGGSDRSTGVFECTGVSVVNGAQTVGAIAHAGLPESAAKVMVRFISLDQCPPEFATEVTRSTNMQNRIDARDFAALDPQQDRLRQELLMEGKVYAYKTGDPTPQRDKGFGLEEATIALACANDVSLAVIAKSAIGRLWEDITRPPYRKLFNSGLGALRLWRLVELLRIIDDKLKSEADTRTDREWSVAVHGNRFVAHRVLSRLDLTNLDNPDFNLDSLKSLASSYAAEEIVATAAASKRAYPAAYMASLFKNTSKCQHLATIIQANAKPAQNGASTKATSGPLKKRKKS